MRAHRRLRSERGASLLEALLMLVPVLLTIAVAIQALAYAHARSVAEAAAQDGARAAAVAGSAAGTRRAAQILAAAGGAGEGLRASVAETSERVTVEVRGPAPRVFPVPLALPAIRSQATLPRERYPAEEGAR